MVYNNFVGKCFSSWNADVVNATSGVCNSPVASKFSARIHEVFSILLFIVLETLFTLEQTFMYDKQS